MHRCADEMWWGLEAAAQVLAGAGARAAAPALRMAVLCAHIGRLLGAAARRGGLSCHRK